MAVNLPQKILVGLPYTIILSGILASIMTGESTGVIFASCALTVEILIHVAKYVVNWMVQNWIGCSTDTLCPNDRPINAGKNGGCGIFLDTTSQAAPQQKGMPSGHSTMMSFAATFVTLYAIGSHRQQTTNETIAKPVAQSLAAWALAVLVMVQRRMSACHTSWQIVIGAGLGTGYGFGIYSLLQTYRPSQFPPAW